MDSLPRWTYLARDERGGVLEQQETVASASNETARRRQRSGNDEGEIPLNGPTIGESMDACIDMIGKIKRKRAAQARDAAIDARRRELARKQQTADRREQRRQELEAQSRQRTRELLDPAFKRARDEAAKSAQIGELGPGGGSFAKQTKQEGAVQRASNLHVTQDTRGRYIDSYADLSGDGYKTAAGKLRGQDVQPRDVCEQMQMEHKRARQRLEARPTP
jgi:hypothetical protein